MMSSKQLNKIRADHNEDLIKRMADGDALYKFDSFASWFPPRPIIRKDSESIRKLYGTEDSPTVKRSSILKIKKNNK